MTRIGLAPIVLAASTFLGAPFALLPLSSAYADCANWNVSGQWVLNQNNGFWVTLDIEQTGSEITGNVKFVTKKGFAYEGLFYSIPPTFLVDTGSVEGWVHGNNIEIVAHWKGGAVGEYTGTISPQGWLEGDTRDRMHSASSAHWTSVDKSANCMDVAAPPPPKPPKAPPPKANPLDKAGVLEKPGPGIGEILKETKPAGAEYATAITPATIYVEPGGAAFKDANGNVIGMPVGSKALVLEKRTNPVWYRLQTKPVGWVWGKDVALRSLKTLGKWRSFASERDLQSRSRTPMLDNRNSKP